jgi:hypothetical protein
MARKPKPEEIIGKLREAEIVLAQSGTAADAALLPIVGPFWPRVFGLLKCRYRR